MAEILTVAIKEGKTLVRDVGALVMLFALPAIFIVVMSVALQGAFASEETGERLDVLLVDEGDGAMRAELIDALEASNRFRVVSRLDGETLTRARAEALLGRGDYRLGVVLPAGVADAVALESGRTVEVIVDPALSSAYAVSVQSIVQGVAARTVIDALVDRTRSLGDEAQEAAEGATKAKAAVEELRTKVDELAKAQRECGDKLRETGEIADMLAGKLRSIKTQLQASGMPADRWPAELRESRPAPSKAPQKKSIDKHEGAPAAAGEAEAVAHVRPLEAGGPAVETAGVETAEVAAGGDADADLDAAADAEAEAEPAPVADAPARTDDEERGVRVAQRYVGSVRGGRGEGPTPNSVQQSVPGWTIFALFWIVQILSVNMVRERLSGSFKRILVSPIPLWKYLLGATLPFFALNLAQAVAMFAIGVLALPWLGCPRLEIVNVPALLLVTTAVSASALGMGLLMAAVSRSLFSAAAVSAIAVVIMAIMGGIMVPRVIMPASMARLGYLVPHGWALDGYIDVLVRGATAGDVLGSVAALLGFALVFFTIAALRFRTLARVA